MNGPKYCGPAFPCTPHDGSPHEFCGMTLRDYFAGMALASGYLSSLDGNHKTSSIAENAYAIADAMLEARNE